MAKLIHKFRESLIVEFLLFFVPFYKKERQRFLEDKISTFSSLQSINEEIKSELVPYITFFENNYVKNVVKYFYQTIITITIYIIISIIIGLFFSFNAYQLIVLNFFQKDNNFHLSDIRTILIQIISPFFFTLLIGILIKEFKFSLYLYLSLMVLLIIITTIEVLLFVYHWDKDIHYVVNGLAGALLTVIVFLPVIMITLFVEIIWMSLYNRKFIKNNALEYIINNLISILYYAENAINNEKTLNYKEKQLKRLENVAKSIEYYLPRRLRSGDIITDNWMNETSKRIAFSIREKKKWILTPKKDTFDYFVNSIAFTLTNIISDNWDALESAEPMKLALPQREKSFLLFILNLLRAILIAGLPIIGIWAFQQTPLAFTGSVRDFVYVGSLVWGLLTFIAMLDPNFSMKISAMKDISSLVTPTKTVQKP